ncbi:MAG: transposase [Melioribacteraceae bacterium]|nr:transposase [Melioribacteraceae bacterium]
MSKFKNTFRIESTRLASWDYSNPGWYFVTINTKNQIKYFGDVFQGEIVLNEFGIITERCWNEISQHFKNVELDYYVIMPNHIHGIIIINPCVETGYIPSLPLGEIIGKFKAAVTRWANSYSCESFSWQQRFFDRIIRNERELLNTRKSIIEIL